MKLNQLTFTRFLAAIAIVVYHYGLKIAPFNHGVIHGFLGASHILVSYFFVLCNGHSLRTKRF
jgi:peptidoglycan/LPS O-acetylase OafA/YrhL